MNGANTSCRSGLGLVAVVALWLPVGHADPQMGAVGVDEPVRGRGLAAASAPPPAAFDDGTRVLLGLGRESLRVPALLEGSAAVPYKADDRRKRDLAGVLDVGNVAVAVVVERAEQHGMQARRHGGRGEVVGDGDPASRGRAVCDHAE